MQIKQMKGTFAKKQVFMSLFSQVILNSVDRSGVDLFILRETKSAVANELASSN